MNTIETVTETNSRYRIRSETEYRAALADMVRRQRLARERPQSDTLRAEINAGRWVVSCPCGAAAELHPRIQFAACFGCGRSWSTIIFPDSDALAAIDEVLALRPQRPESVIPLPWYSWTADQTVEDLRRENSRFNWPVPEAA